MTSQLDPLSQSPLSAATPSIEDRSRVIQPQPRTPRSSNPAGNVPRDHAPKDQRTNKLGLDEPIVKPTTGQSPLALGLRGVTASAPIAAQEQPALVHKSEKSESNTYEIPISSLGAGSIASQDPLVPKSSAAPKEIHAPTSYGNTEALEEKTRSLQSHTSVDPEASALVPVTTTPNPLIVSLSYKPYAIT